MAGPAIRCLELGRALARTGRTGPVTVASLTAATLADPDVEVVAAADAAVLRKLVARVGSVVVQGDVLGLHPWLADVGRAARRRRLRPLPPRAAGAGPGAGGGPAARRRPRRRAGAGPCSWPGPTSCSAPPSAAAGAVDRSSRRAGPGQPRRRTTPHRTSPRLVAVVPFGAPDAPARPGDRTAVAAAIPNLAPGDRIVLWGGGIYDWFDPGTVIRAVGRLAADRPDLKLLFLGTRHPAQGGVGAATAGRARALAGDLGLLGTVVHFHDGWVPHGERDRWMSAATVAVSAHLRHLETEFSYRTRLVDYLWCGLPVITTAGDELAALRGHLGRRDGGAAGRRRCIHGGLGGPARRRRPTRSCCHGGPCGRPRTGLVAGRRPAGRLLRRAPQGTRPRAGRGRPGAARCARASPDHRVAARAGGRRVTRGRAAAAARPAPPAPRPALSRRAGRPARPTRPRLRSRPRPR